MSVILFISSSVSSPALRFRSIWAILQTRMANLLPIPLMTRSANPTLYFPFTLVFYIRNKCVKSSAFARIKVYSNQIELDVTSTIEPNSLTLSKFHHLSGLKDRKRPEGSSFTDQITSRLTIFPRLNRDIN